MTQTSLGIMVLLTGLGAATSGYFAVSTVAQSPLARVAFSVFYGTTILFFDRELVGNTNRAAVWARLPIAVLIGMALSLPLELKLMEARINAELRQATLDRRKPDIERMAAIESDMVGRRQAERVRLEGIDQELQRLSKRKEEEYNKPGRPGRGSIYESFQRDYDARVLERDRIAEEMKGLHLTPAEAHEVAELRQSVEAEAGAAGDLLGRIEALERITKASPAALALTWLLRLFLITWECFPVIIKMFLPKSEYHAYLDSRRALNIHRIHTMANFTMAEVTANPVNQPPEFTDAIAPHLEDSASKVLGVP